MSENYDDDQDVEKLIFKGGLASGAIEPSEKFWNKAYENILERDARGKRNKISDWKAACFTTVAVALLLGFYSYYMHNEVSDIKQQLTRIESVQKTLAQQNTNQTTQTTTTEQLTTLKDFHSINSDNSTGKSTAKPETTFLNTASANKFTYKDISNHHAQYTSPDSINFSVNTPKLNMIANQVSAAINPISANAAGTSNLVNPDQNGNVNKSNVNAPLNTPAGQVVRTITPTPLTLNSTTKQAANSAATNKTTATNAADLDSSNALYLNRRPVTFKSILSKISVSAFYAPGKTDDFLSDKDNDPTHTITAHLLKTQQDGDGTFAAGLRLAYAISDKWSILSGCYYSLYTYNINPTIIYAQQQENGQIGYSVTTSSGTVFLPYSATTTHVGDSIKVKGSSSRGYISVPLQAKYKYLATTRLSFYVVGGFALNIANNKETQIHWENTALQEGDITIQNIYGLNTVQYSYNFGLGAEFLIGKGLSVYTEPYLNGSFTSINNNTPVITYPYFFGLALGLTYRF